MIAKAPSRTVLLRPKVEILLAHHGAIPVIWALARALLNPRHRKTRPPDPYHLSPHLRRDIGLPPDGPYVPKYYELR